MKEDKVIGYLESYETFNYFRLAVTSDIWSDVLNNLSTEYKEDPISIKYREFVSQRWNRAGREFALYAESLVKKYSLVYPKDTLIRVNSAGEILSEGGIIK